MYYGRSDRPVITTCPAKISTDGGAYRIPIGGSQGTNIGKVALVRAGSVTHAFDTDQRLIVLDITTKTAAAVERAGALWRGGSASGRLHAVCAAGGGIRLQDMGAVRRLLDPGRASGRAPRDFDRQLPDRLRWHQEPGLSADLGGRIRGRWRPALQRDLHARRRGLGRAAQHGRRHLSDRIQHVEKRRLPAGAGGQLSGRRSDPLRGDLEKRAGPVWTAYHGASEATHVTNFNTFKEQGYRPVNISAVNVNGRRSYTALYDKANVGTYHTLTGMTEAQYQTEFNNQVKAGRRVSYVNAFMEGGVPKISAIWDQSDAGGWSARHDLTGANFQHEWDNHIGQGFQTRRTAGYEKGGIARFAAIWTKK